MTKRQPQTNPSEDARQLVEGALLTAANAGRLIEDLEIGDDGVNALRQHLSEASNAFGKVIDVSAFLIELSENPSKFKNGPLGSLDDVWRLRRDAFKVLELGRRISEQLSVSSNTAYRIVTSEVNKFSRVDVEFAATLLRKPANVERLKPRTEPTAQSAELSSAERISMIRRSRLFDSTYYCAQVLEPLLGEDPIKHYVEHGWKLDLRPNPIFSPKFMKRQFNALDGSTGDLLSQYIKASQENIDLDPHPLFSASYYRAQLSAPFHINESLLENFIYGDGKTLPHPVFSLKVYAKASKIEFPNVAAALLHYLATGWLKGLEFSGVFRARYYLDHLEASGGCGEPYEHYILEGARMGISPSPVCDQRVINSLADSLGGSSDPLLNYVVDPAAWPVSPSAYLDATFYLKSQPDDKPKAAPLIHYLDQPWGSETNPLEFFDNRAYSSNIDRKSCFMDWSPLEEFAFRVQAGEFSSQVKLIQCTTHIESEAPGPLRSDMPKTSASVFVSQSNTGDDTSRSIQASTNAEVREYPGKAPEIVNSARVLVVAHAAGEHLFGGERSFLDMVSGLRSAGYNVLVALPRNVPDYTNLIRPFVRRVFVFKYDWWREGVECSERVIEKFLDIIKRERVDAVHANTIMLRECVVAARRVGVPTVVHVRELITSDEGLVAIIGKSSAAIVSDVVNRTDWIIGNSAATSKIFNKPGKTFIIENTADFSSLEIQNKLSNVINFGIVSSNIEKKGIRDVVSLALLAEERNIPAIFHLIGPETPLIAQLRGELKRLDRGRNIVFAGYSRNPQDAMEKLNVLLNFSHFAESFGRTVLEGMAARRPIIAYEWGAIPELVEHGVNGYLVPFRRADLALEYVEKLCHNQDLLESLGEAGRRKALASYSFEAYVGKLDKAYKEILRTTPVNEKVPSVVKQARSEELGAGRRALKVAYFCWHFPVPSETFVLNELEQLIAEGVDVEVFCRQIPDKNFKITFKVKYTRVSSWRELAKCLVESGRTIVHAHFAYPTVTDMVWPACEESQIPFTFIAHAQDIFKDENDQRNRLREVGASPLCLTMFTLSQFHLQFVVARGFPKAKVVINPNAVNVERFSRARMAGRESRRFKRVVAIHRYVPKKGLDLLIKAAALLKDLQIKIEIYGYGECKKDYLELCRACEADNVYIGGQLTQEEIIEVLRTADLFACPSVRIANGDMDGIPTSIVESMAGGIPVLATNIAGIPDLVIDGVTGILVEPTPQAVADGIRRFYSMTQLRVRALIEAGQNRAVSRHDAKRLCRVLRRVWENLTLDILVVSWNNLLELQMVTTRILENTSLPYHLIICDNRSSLEPVPEYIDDLHRDHERVTVIHNSSNAMVGPGTNECLRQGSGDIAIYVCGKEGVSFSRGWEIPFVHAFAENELAGLVGSIGYSPTYLLGEQYPNGIPLFRSFRNQSFATDNPKRTFGHVQGGLFGIRREMVEIIGGFSDLVPHDYTDVEYSFYAESMNWRLGEVENVLALFNKSRPTLSQRLVEDVVVAHPVMPEQIEVFEAMMLGRLNHCNVCDWFGERFSNDCVCPSCFSTPNCRSIFRYLSDSIYMYRRLPAIAIGLEGRAERIWAEQFQGPRLTREEALEYIGANGRLKNSSSKMGLGILRLASVSTANSLTTLASEFSRLLANDAPMILNIDIVDGNFDSLLDEADTIFSVFGFTKSKDYLYTSRALEFSPAPFKVFCRSQ